MKTRRFFSFFFCLIVLTSLLAPARAAKDDTGDLEVEAKAALLIDPDTEELLYARNIHERLYPASLTKIMTCLLVLESLDRGEIARDTVLTASDVAVNSIPPDGSTAGIKAGEELTVESLLYCIMLSSANEGCNILAEGVAGSIDAFVDRMNAKAQAIGCEDTNFVNTNGLPDDYHYTTAWDLYLITKEARTHADFMPIVSTIYFEVPATNLSEPRKLYTTNYLVSSYRTSYYLYQGAQGIKTGSTSAAGYCLVSSATRSGRSLLSVVLGAERVTLEDGTVLTKSFTETAKLFDWGFDNFRRQVILDAGELVAEVPVELSQQQNSVKVHPAREVDRLLPKDLDPVKDIDREVIFDAESVDAPVAKGQVLGQIVLSRENTVYATVDLLADEDVSASKLLVFRRDLMEFLQRPDVWIAAGGAALLVVLGVILRSVLRSSRRRYGRSAAGRRSSSGYRGRRR
ncbi:MAG: D-alanyl-D-alanine carboxypeptidase [Oscillospiraceae bacterium]|jgi:D-alanyl-D-alanine carboxypeptidase (penicillin-binding protein 5/6)|nr:D-alanyl-D-alanine carboxypeptidase [Oscillospiraceae bacterium]